MVSLASSAQTLEGFLQEWIADAPNGYNNVFKKYGREGNGLIKDIDALGATVSDTKRYYVHFEMNLEGTLDETFEFYRKKIAQFDFLRGWALDKPPHTPGITYRQGKGDQNYVQFGLQQYQNYDGTKGPIVSLWIVRACSYCTTNTPDKNTIPPPRKNTYSIIELLQTQKGKFALQALFADAENDFENIIDRNSLNQGVYQIKTNFLNPAAEFPFIYVTETMDTRSLVIRFLQPTQKKRFVTEKILNDPSIILKETLALDWQIATTSQHWEAIPKAGADSYKKLNQVFDSYGDHLELKVIRKPYRKENPAYQLAGQGGCKSGNCVEGFGELVYHKGEQAYRYIGQFKSAKFHGLGVLYRTGPGQSITEDGRPIPTYIGQFIEGEKAGLAGKYRIEPIAKYWPAMDANYRRRKAEEGLQESDLTASTSYYLFSTNKKGEVLREQVHFLHHQAAGMKPILIDKPFAAAFGNCLSGDCQNGEGVLRLEGIGDFRGKFIDGTAYLTGLLTVETGEVFSVWVEFGFPKRFRTVKLPEGVSRLDLAKRRVWKMTAFDCLEGNCWNGNGKQFFGDPDRFSQTPLEEGGLTGILEGAFQKGRPGHAVLLPLSGRNLQITGNFTNDLDGAYQVLNQGRGERWNFRNNHLISKGTPNGRE